MGSQTRFSKSVFDNSVHVASRLSVRRIIARRIHASEVFAHPAIPAQPSRRPIHRPPLGKNLESAVPLPTHRDIEPATRPLSPSSPISPRIPRPLISDEASETARPASLAPASRRLAPGRSPDETAASSVSPRVSTMTRRLRPFTFLPASHLRFCGLRAPAVYDRRARLGVSPVGSADFGAEGVVDALQRFVGLPRSEVGIDGLLAGRQFSLSCR